MQMALGSCISVYGGISRDSVHVNNQPIMFWSHLKKGDALVEGDLCGHTCFSFSFLSAANPLTGFTIVYLI